MRVEAATGEDLAASLKLLEESLRESDALPEEFVARFRKAVEAGDYQVMVARDGNDVVGVVVLSYRLSVSAGGRFASIEELYVRPDARRRGVGRDLLEEVGRRCRARGVSYVEAQTVDEAAGAFYAAVGYGYEEDVRVMSRSYAL